MSIKKSLLAVLLFSGLALSTPPILRSGQCPTFTRSVPPETQSGGWSQYPVKPTTAFVQGCTSTALQNCTIQDPLPTPLSINCIVVPAGLRAELIASELTPGPAPSLGYMMYFTFDERGRTWVAEPRDYPFIANDPNPSNRATGGTGRILILEDTDGDGSLDNYKVFYSGLVMPTSVEVVTGGVIATVEPYIYFIPRSTTNPDTAGGAPVAIVSGTGCSNNTWDTHGGTNSLFMGLDNWYYGHKGYNQGGCSSPSVSMGGSTAPAVAFSPGSVYRFKSVLIGSSSTVFQHWVTGPSNAHGAGQMEDGQIFHSGATGTPHNNHALRRAACCATTQATINIQTSGTYYPITGDRWMWEGSTGMTNGNYTTSTSATSGHDFYTSRLLPTKYWSRFSFACEGASKLCNQDSMVVNGSTWSPLRMTGPINSNIFASTDAWVAPIKVRTGPDGGLWVLDWHNYLFLHNPAGPATNAAWQNALRVKSRTRLYRIMPDDGRKEPVLNLTNATTAQLVNTLFNQNFLWRMQAQRLLIAKGYSAELGDSLQNILVNHRTNDTVGIDGPVIHAIWTLEGLGQFAANPLRWDPILRNLLLHPAWGVRENVLKAMPRTTISAQSISDACAADDPHPHVRLQAYLALAESPAASLTGVVQGHFRATDTYSSAAFDAAGTTKLAAATPANTRPSTCPAIGGSTVSLSDAKRSQPRHDLRFSVIHNGFVLQPYGQLPSGEMVVYDVRGEVAFRSVYNSGKAEWSDPVAKGLNLPVYFYFFQGANGEQFHGRITLASEL